MLENTELHLQGNGVLLEPLGLKHLDGLSQVVMDGRLWTLQDTVIPHPDTMRDYIVEAAYRTTSGEERVFAIIDSMTRRVTGSTRFRGINYDHKRAIIGPTFLGKSWQGSHVNTESKYLLLKQAFEVWKFNRIELLCDVRNVRSRSAIKKLGAKQEGIIRAHRVMPDGRIRDTVVHSILATEWSEVKQGLKARLNQYDYSLSA